MRDRFVLFAPGLSDSPRKGVIRIKPATYDRVAQLSQDTGLSICRIVSQAIDFALDHMEDNDDAE